jgi:hypothetical protein
MAMDGEVISKVRRKNCGGPHKFRDPLVAQKVRKPTAKKGTGEAATAEIVRAVGLAEVQGKERDYSMASIYRHRRQGQSPNVRPGHRDETLCQ